MSGRGVRGWVQLSWLFVPGLLEVCVWDMSRVSAEMGVDGFSFVVGIKGPGASIVGVMPRVCVSGEGCHALH